MAESGKKVLMTSFTGSLSDRFLMKTFILTISSNGTSILSKIALIFFKHRSEERRVGKEFSYRWWADR